MAAKVTVQPKPNTPKKSNNKSIYSTVFVLILTPRLSLTLEVYILAFNFIYVLMRYFWVKNVLYCNRKLA